MEIDYDKDFEKVMTELQTNFGWSNIKVLPDSYRDLLNDTIKAVKNCSIHDVSLSLTDLEEEYEPYFGWCDVDGCENEGANGGGCWRETGYWTVCSKHSSKYRAGEPQPPMKQTAIDREKRRGADGVLVNEG